MVLLRSMPSVCYRHPLPINISAFLLGYQAYRGFSFLGGLRAVQLHFERRRRRGFSKINFGLDRS